MAHPDPAAQIAVALGALLLRGNRVHLYGQLTDEVAGVDSTTYPVLSGLARSGPITASRLADLVGLDRTVTTRYATRLEDAGLITRTPDPSDARATRLALTRQGRRAVTTMRSALESTLAQAVQTWAPGEAEIFARALQRLVDALIPAAVVIPDAGVGPDPAVSWAAPVSPGALAGEPAAGRLLARRPASRRASRGARGQVG